MFQSSPQRRSCGRNGRGSPRPAGYASPPGGTARRRNRAIRRPIAAIGVESLLAMTLKPAGSAVTLSPVAHPHVEQAVLFAVDAVLNASRSLEWPRARTSA